MSKIGKLLIVLPAQTEVKLEGDMVIAKGPKGELSWKLPSHISVEQAGGRITVKRDGESNLAKSLHGLVRSKIANMVRGVSQGYEKVLEISGVGFRAEVKDKVVVLSVGLSHPVTLPIIEGTDVKTAKNEIIVSGIDKEAVGEMAARIRAVKKPEPYKGKGIKYKDEVIRRKAGKTAKTVG